MVFFVPLVVPSGRSEWYSVANSQPTLPDFNTVVLGREASDGQVYSITHVTAIGYGNPSSLGRIQAPGLLTPRLHLAPAPAGKAKQVFSVTEINNLAELSSYHLQWQRLLAVTPQATFFHTLGWLTSYWEHFGERQKLRVLFVHAQGELVGIVPLVVRQERTRLGPLRVLTYPLDHWGTFFSPLGRQQALTLWAAMKHIASGRRDWDLVDVRWVDRDGVDRGRTPRAMMLAGLRPAERRMHEVSQIDLAGSWDAYWRGLDGHWRNNVRRSEKRLALQGRVTHVRYRPAGSACGDDEPRWDLFEACVSVARASWQHRVRGGGNTLSHPGVSEFLRTAHLAAVKAGAADINLLYVDERPVAFAYNYVWCGAVYGLRTGYHEELGQAGAGSVLMARMLQDSFARRDATFDLGPDETHIKRHWTTYVKGSYQYTYYSWGLRAQALRWRRRLAGKDHPVREGRQALSRAG